MPSADAARARFNAATAAHLTAPLAEGILLRHVSYAEVVASSEKIWAIDPRPTGRLDALFSAEQREAIQDLAEVQGAPLSHYIHVERGGELIGTYWGQQHPWGRYYMVNSIFRPDLRGKGLYKALLPRVVAAVAASGFSEIYSRHRADNNAILVPKLKEGFAIAGFEVAPRFGLLVHLRKYLIEGLDHAFRYRIDGAYAGEMRDKKVVTE